MNRLVRKILGHLPRRRRRLWRYVSLRRRGAVLLLLALLVVAAWVYWSLTNDDRVRRQARSYLRWLCGGKVEIGRGHFSLLQGIELSDVRIHVPGSLSPEPFLRAKKVILRHGPWRMFVTGKLQPTEVVCLEPVVTLEYDVQANRYNFQAFFTGPGSAARWGGAWPPFRLPFIRVRQGSLRWVDVDDRLRMPFEPLPVALSMIPKGNTEYLVTFEEQRHGQEAAISGKFALNVQTGAVRILYGAAPIPNLDKALPGKYRQWRQRYGIAGEVRLKSAQEASAPSGQMECELVNVSLKLPPEEGGLDLVGVDGTVCFDQNGVALRGIRGRARQAGEARFEISGRYEGYDPNSPFDLKLEAWSASAPSGRTVEGELGRMLKAFEDSFEVSGRMNLAGEIKRLPGGKMVFQARLEPLGMSVCFKPAPYRLDDLRGLVVVSPDQVELRQVRARRQGATFALDGVVGLGGAGGADIAVQARDVLLDGELRAALPDRARRIWDQNNPGGRLSGQARIQCNEKNEVTHFEITLDADGTASMSRCEFPYRLENLLGKVHVSDGFVSIEQLRAGRGPMRCVINGTCRKADTSEPDSDIAVEVRRLPLDDALLAAMPQSARGFMESLHAAGQAESATVKLTQIAGGETHYDIRATLSDGRFKPDAFPYEVAGAAGIVEIRPGVVVVKGLTGRHGPSSVLVNGQAFIGETVGLDLDVKAQAVAFDQALFDALPDRARDIWRRLSPSGTADMDVHLMREMPERPGQTEYRLVLSPKDARIRYEGFPYAFGGVNGTVVVTPSRIDIEELRAAQGAMRGSLSGSIILERGAEQADLRICARDLAVSQELIAAMPSEMSALVDRFSPGGTCDVDLSRLSLTRAEQPMAAGPTSEAASAASQQNAGPAAFWNVEGGIRFRDAALNLDFGQRTMSGTVSGSARRDSCGLRLDADIALSEVMLGRRRLTDVRGRLTKAAAGAIMRIDHLSAKVHGGRATGFAEIRLSQPPQYGLRLSVEDMELAELFSSGSPQPRNEPEVAGLLAGNIEMTATAGRPESRQASGLLKITKGRIYRLPVVMGFVHVIYLWVPGKAAFTEGEVAYRIQGQRLIFDEIFLRGPALSVVGSGTMNMSTEALDLTFLTGPPGKLPRIAAVESLLKGLAREIAEIRVSGTLAKPLPQTVSLPGLDEAVRRLLSPGEQ
jgi:hypothetical protein